MKIFAKTSFLLFVVAVFIFSSFVSAPTQTSKVHAEGPGCTDPAANNFNPDATEDDGSCTYTYYGCTDPVADNYDPGANTDDGSCTYTYYGCTDPAADNYDSIANTDDGSCMYPPPPVSGCTDSAADNYVSDATVDDGSCTYSDFYFNGASDGDWNNVANWWTDNGFSVPAESLPTSSDDVIISGTINTNSGPIATVNTFIVGGINFISIIPVMVTTLATFNDSSCNYNSNITGAATFHDSSCNGGTVSGNAAFTGTSYNDGIVTGNATFANSSQNNDTVSGNAIFYTLSHNAGTVSGEATFNGSSYNSNSIENNATFNSLSHNEGVVSGSALFDGASINNNTVRGDATFNCGTTNNGTVLGATTNVPCSTFYFSGTSDGDWNNLDNWWFNNAFTVSTGGLPTAGDDVVILSAVTANNGPAAVANTLTVSSSNYTDISITVTDTATFSNSSYNNSDINGNTVFTSSSYNQGTVTGTATFSNSSFNSGTVNGNADFTNSSYNNGTVTGDATFDCSSTNSGTVNGTITSTCTHTLTYSAGAGGTLTGDASQTVDDGTDGTAITAVPDEGYVFVDWSDAAIDNPRTDTGVTDDITVTANFSSTTPEDTTPPDTVINSSDTDSSTATFEFSADDPLATFECRLDAAEFVPCTSPYATPVLAVGEHSFEVRAIDVFDNIDPTPATEIWTTAEEDVTTEAPILSSPTSSSSHISTSSLEINFTLPETPLSGSITLTFTLFDGTGTPIVLTLVDAAPEVENIFSITPSGGIGNVEEVIDTTADSIPVGTYNVTISYQDVSGNPPATAIAADVTITAPSTPTTSPGAVPLIFLQFANSQPGIIGQTTNTTNSPTSPSFMFTRTLRLRMTGEDVRQLQIFLNAQGFTVSPTGPGSPGNETTRFGAKTRAALIKYQEAHAKEILTPVGLTKGSGLFGPSTMRWVNANH